MVLEIRTVVGNLELLKRVAMNTFSRTFYDTRSVKVIVVPIGENSLFNDQFEVLCQHNETNISDLTIPSDWRKRNSLLKNFNWSFGTMKFEFFRYDRMAQGPSDLDNFQNSRRILLIIGLMNFPEFVKQTKVKVEDELESYIKSYPSILIRRYFVFNFEFENGKPLNDLSQSLLDSESMVVLPPADGMCEGGSMIDVHINEIMNVISVKLITLFDNQITYLDQVRLKNVFPTSLTSLMTQYDDVDIENDGYSNKLKSNLKKRPTGRIRKWLGDTCLQVCSPIDALEHYSTAITECRATNDIMWLAASLDGYVTSIILLYKLQIPLDDILGKELKAIIQPNVVQINSLNNTNLTSQQSSDIMKMLRIADEKITEALNLYSKHEFLSNLEVELTLRLAKFYEELSPNILNSFYSFMLNTSTSMSASLSGSSSSSDIITKEIKILDYIMQAIAIPGLSPMQQIECILEGSLICKRLGLHRKHALFVYLAALISTENNHTSLAYNLISKACDEYGISISKPMTSAVDNDANSPSQISKSCWPSMVKSLLSHAINLSKECNDVQGCLGNVTTLLSFYTQQQQKHHASICTWSKVQDNILEAAATLAVTGAQKANGTSVLPGLSPLSDESILSMQQYSTNTDPSSNVAVDISDAVNINSRKLTMIPPAAAPIANVSVNSISITDNLSSYSSSSGKYVSLATGLSSALKNSAATPSIKTNSKTNILGLRPNIALDFNAKISNTLSNGFASGLDTESFTQSIKNLVDSVPILTPQLFAHTSSTAAAVFNTVASNTTLISQFNRQADAKRPVSGDLTQLSHSVSHTSQEVVSSAVSSSSKETVVTALSENTSGSSSNVNLLNYLSSKDLELLLSISTSILDPVTVPTQLTDQAWNLFYFLTKLTKPGTMIKYPPYLQSIYGTVDNRERSVDSMNYSDVLGSILQVNYALPIEISPLCHQPMVVRSPKILQCLDLLHEVQNKSSDSDLAVTNTSNVEKASSSLFYDPFIAKNKQSNMMNANNITYCTSIPYNMCDLRASNPLSEGNHSNSVVWIVNQTSTVCVSISNYLNISMKIDGVSLIIGYSDNKYENTTNECKSDNESDSIPNYVIYPVKPIVLPPYSVTNDSHSHVDISLKMMKEGVYTLKDIVLYINNVQLIFPIVDGKVSITSSLNQCETRELKQPSVIHVIRPAALYDIVSKSSTLTADAGLTSLPAQKADQNNNAKSVDLYLYSGETYNEKIILKAKSTVQPLAYQSKYLFAQHTSHNTSFRQSNDYDMPDLISLDRPSADTENNSNILMNVSNDNFVHEIDNSHSSMVGHVNNNAVEWIQLKPYDIKITLHWWTSKTSISSNKLMSKLNPTVTKKSRVLKDFDDYLLAGSGTGNSTSSVFSIEEAFIELINISYRNIDIFSSTNNSSVRLSEIYDMPDLNNTSAVSDDDIILDFKIFSKNCNSTMSVSLPNSQATKNVNTYALSVDRFQVDVEIVSSTEKNMLEYLNMLVDNEQNADIKQEKLKEFFSSNTSNVYSRIYSQSYNITVGASVTSNITKCDGVEIISCLPLISNKLINIEEYFKIKSSNEFNLSIDFGLSIKDYLLSSSLNRLISQKSESMNNLMGVPPTIVMTNLTETSRSRNKFFVLTVKNNTNRSGLMIPLHFSSTESDPKFRPDTYSTFNNLLNNKPHDSIDISPHGTSNLLISVDQLQTMISHSNESLFQWIFVDKQTAFSNSSLRVGECGISKKIMDDLHSALKNNLSSKIGINNIILSCSHWLQSDSIIRSSKISVTCKTSFTVQISINFFAQESTNVNYDANTVLMLAIVIVPASVDIKRSELNRLEYSRLHSDLLVDGCLLRKFSISGNVIDITNKIKLTALKPGKYILYPFIQIKDAVHDCNWYTDHEGIQIIVN